MSYYAKEEKKKKIEGGGELNTVFSGNIFLLDMRE